jgi:Glycosyltransferase (GlcNAc)
MFLQVPAYRDSQLPFTIRDLFEQAHRPERLRVLIAWQYGNDELHLERELKQWKNIELLKIPAARSQGCNWARRLLQEKWDGETYTLLLDSHHRFAPGWDEEAVAMLEELRSSGASKPILTGYLPPYDPYKDPEGRATSIFRIRPVERYEGLLFRLVGDPVADESRLSAPLPARFTSLHFLFADGSLNEDLAIDDSIYFFVDEIAIALRAYTRGYDLFHPHRVLGWHLYDRATRVTHWRDHARWRMQHDLSCKRVRALYSGRLRGKYGVGTARTVADYEALVGQPLVTPEAWV